VVEPGELTEEVVRKFAETVNAGEVESQAGDGRSLIVNYTNSTWGSIRTLWKFIVEGDRLARFEPVRPVDSGASSGLR